MAQKEIVYDYKNQAWIINGIYQTCNHPDEMECNCYGKINKGKKALAIIPKGTTKCYIKT